MLCKKCREQIEVGEACFTEKENGHTTYYHTGCHAAETKERDEKKRILNHYEEQANLARSVC